MEQDNNRCFFILLPREIQLMVVSVIEVDDLLSLVQVAMFNHVLNKDGFIIREVWLRIAKQLHWNESTSNAWIKRTAKKVGSGRYCLYCGRVTQAKIPLSWMAEYNLKRRICLDCFTGRKGVQLITKSAIRFRFKQLAASKLSFLEWRYDSNRDQEYLLSQVERLSTGEYEPPTEFRTAFELHYKSTGGKKPATNFNKNNNTSKGEPRKKASKLLKDFGGGSKPTPVSTKISPFSNLNKQSVNMDTISSTVEAKKTEIKEDPIIIVEGDDDDFQAPKIKKAVFKPVENNNYTTVKPKTPTDPAKKKQRKPNAKTSTPANKSNLMSMLVSIAKNDGEKSVQRISQEKSNNNDVVMVDLTAAQETSVKTTEDLQNSSSSVASNSNISEASFGSQDSADPAQLTKPKISKKRSVKPKPTATTNNELSLSTSVKTPFKRPRRTEDQSPTDENGLAISSPKKRLKKANNQSPHMRPAQNDVKTEPATQVEEKVADPHVNQL